MATGLNATLITVVPNTTIKSSDANSNWSALNSATAFWGMIQTIRNGTAQVNNIFTGTNTPVSPTTGDIWIQS